MIGLLQCHNPWVETPKFPPEVVLQNLHLKYEDEHISINPKTSEISTASVHILFEADWWRMGGFMCQPTCSRNPMRGRHSGYLLMFTSSGVGSGYAGPADSCRPRPWRSPRLSSAITGIASRPQQAAFSCSAHFSISP